MLPIILHSLTPRCSSSSSTSPCSPHHPSPSHHFTSPSNYTDNTSLSSHAFLFPGSCLYSSLPVLPLQLFDFHLLLLVPVYDESRSCTAHEAILLTEAKRSTQFALDSTQSLNTDFSFLHLFSRSIGVDRLDADIPSCILCRHTRHKVFGQPLLI